MDRRSGGQSRIWRSGEKDSIECDVVTIMVLY